MITILVADVFQFIFLGSNNVPREHFPINVISVYPDNFTQPMTYILSKFAGLIVYLKEGFLETDCNPNIQNYPIVSKLSDKNPYTDFRRYFI